MICRECGAEKPHTDFYESNKSRCKDCVKASVRLRRKENPAVQEYDRKRGNRQNLTDLRKYREANPKKYKAQTWVNNAVRDGRLVKAHNSQLCNSNFAIEGHHDDYDQPKVVRWLCSRCHSLWHTEHGEALNPF